MCLRVVSVYKKDEGLMDIKEDSRRAAWIPESIDVVRIGVSWIVPQRQDPILQRCYH